MTRYFHGILPDRNSPLGHTTHAHMAQVNQGRGIKHETLGRKFKSCANDPTPLVIRLENIELHENQITILSVWRTPRNTKQLSSINVRKLCMMTKSNGNQAPLLIKTFVLSAHVKYYVLQSRVSQLSTWNCSLSISCKTTVLQNFLPTNNILGFWSRKKFRWTLITQKKNCREKFDSVFIA